jgi:CRP/FNR family transcriptional regulator, cyclic AMP receptor protein
VTIVTEELTHPKDAFISALDPADLVALRACGRRRRFRAGTSLFHEGERSEWLALIEQGLVKVSSFTEGGREIVLAFRGPGELMGEISVIDAEPRSATAIALKPVQALIVPAGDFLSFLQMRPNAALVLLRTLTRRLREADRRRIEFVAYDTVGRVARHLVELAERHGKPTAEGIRIELLTQMELAGAVGAARESVAKVLQILRARGWIRTRRRVIVVLDLAALRARSV